MTGDVCYPLASPSGSLKWAELFSSDLTLSQALMVMSHSLLGLSPQLEPPCSENKSQVWPLTGNEPQTLGSLAWHLEAGLCGPFQLLVSYTGKLSRQASLLLLNCHSDSHGILSTAQEKGSSPRAVSQHSTRSPSLLQGPLDRPIGAHLPEGRQGKAGHLQGTDQFWKPFPRLLFSIYNHH